MDLGKAIVIVRAAVVVALLVLGGYAFAQYIEDGNYPTVRGGLLAIGAALGLTGAGALLTVILRERKRSGP